MVFAVHSFFDLLQLGHLVSGLPDFVSAGHQDHFVRKIVVTLLPDEKLLNARLTSFEFPIRPIP